MREINFEPMIEALGKKLNTYFIVTINPENIDQVRLVSVKGHLRTPYTNYVSKEALAKYIAYRLDE